MRILIINSEYPPIGGGASNASANLAEALVTLGQEVVVITSKFKDLPENETADEVLIKRVWARRERSDRSGAIEQISFIFGGGLGCFQLVRSWRPDIVFAFFGIPSGVIGFLLRWVYKIPYIVSLRGGDVPGFRPYDFALYHRLVGPFLRIIWRNAGAVVANSQGLKDLAQAFYAKSKIDIIPNGVNPEKFFPHQRKWDEPHLLFIGRVVYQKGLDILFQALGDLLDIPWQLTIVGDGPEHHNLVDMTHRLGIQERTKFVGWKHNSELVAFYQWATIFVNPSRHEGMPNAVLEAMAMGLPVIASKISGNEELVIPGENGVLVPPDNPDALARALKDLIFDPEKCAQMGAASRKKVVSSYTWKDSAFLYQRLLEDVYANEKFHSKAD